MKKYVNGKLYEMTEDEIAKFRKRFGNRTNSYSNTSDYESRVKELENTVATLLAKLSESEQK